MVIFVENRDFYNICVNSEAQEASEAVWAQTGHIVPNILPGASASILRLRLPDD